MSSTTFELRLDARLGERQLELSLESQATRLVVVGPNGAGKSSLLACLLGALPVARGRIVVAGRVLLDTERGVAVPTEQRRLGYLPQDYALFPHWSVRDNLRFALEQTVPKLGRKERERRCAALLAELGLEALALRSPRTLSGGEQQRVALARALAPGPRALLLDEPLAALDVHARSEVRGFLSATLERLALPTVIVTHEPADARALGGQLLVLERGRVTQLGAWQELQQAPASDFVRSFTQVAAG